MHIYVVGSYYIEIVRNGSWEYHPIGTVDPILFQVTLLGVWQYLHVEAIQSIIARERPQLRAALYHVTIISLYQVNDRNAYAISLADIVRYC